MSATTDHQDPALRRATTAVARLLAVLGTGQQHLVCSDGRAAAITTVDVVLCGEEMTLHHTAADTWALARVLARALTSQGGGGLVVRTSATQDTAERVRGWRVRDGWLTPLTAAQVFSAYCTDAVTGDPLSPERGIEYCPGLPIPSPEELS
ncbi:hypothetical protein AB0G73_24380 [Streptomyces sp. NPDC020719]|uniref:hypothetical protein n=1 Tax=Streptomyces sp. NPDC020719 TaxID=3154896 RepID=UPI0033C4A84B